MSRAVLAVSRLAAPREPLESAIGEAREALEFWSRRARRMPWYRRAARREARLLAATWRVRLIGAHLHRWRLRGVHRLLVPLLDTRGRTGGAHLRSLVWIALRRTALGRRILIGTAAFAAAGVGCLALLIALATELVPS